MAEDVFKEVDDELKAERMRQLARRYAGAGLGLIVAVLAGAGAWAWHVSNQKTAALDATGTYLAALRQTDHLPPAPASGTIPYSETAQAGLASLQKLAAASPNGIATLARLQAGGVLAAHGDTKGALAAWDAVQADTHADPLLRELASLIWCQKQLDNGDPATLRSRLSLLTGKDKAWHGLATESLAILDVRENHLEEARKKFAALAAEQDVPSGVRSRAQAMTQALDPSAG
ncbi:MAG: tetratricopeptide repeat protein [Acetobacter sp.]|uniref:tetratricopeptide repeat protein n=1 Tax=Acetobacter sp. TaxID=440 RepID=UPI003F918E56